MQPTPYERTTEFAQEQTNNVGGRSTVRTARVDAELDAVSLSMTETQDNLELIQRDDGDLRDNTVKAHTLAAEVRAMLAAYGATPRGPWVTATEYSVKDLVSFTDTNTYMSVTAHTSGVFLTDLAANKWILFTLGTAVGASAVVFAPTATIAATNVQAAINESDTENRVLSAAALAASSTLQTDLADISSASLGAALVGFSGTVAYTTGVGSILRYFFGRTAAEIAAGVTPTNYGYMHGDVRRYGAVCDGATDDTTAINRAMSTGHAPIFQAGTVYRITGPLSVFENQVVDFNFSTIKMDDATGLLSHVLIGDNTTQMNGVKIRNGIFTRVQAATAGAALLCRYIGDTWIENCRVFGESKIFRGIDISRGIRVRIAGNFIQSTVNNGVLIQGTGTGANRAVDIEVLSNRFDSVGNTGLNCFDFTEGVFCRGNIFYNCGTASAAVNATNTTNGLLSFKFQTNDFDTTTGTGTGLYLQNVSNIAVEDNWFSNNAGVNLRADDGVDTLLISSNQLYSSTQKSIQISADNVTIVGNLISGGDDGIFVRSQASAVLIETNTITGMTGYGVNLFEAPVTVRVDSNMFLSNTTGNVSSGSAISTVASAAALPIPAEFDIFNVSGTTNISTMTGGWAGRTVTLIFSGVLTITHATGTFNSIRLNGAADFTTAANNTLTITHNGIQWYEIGRAS